MGRTTPAHIEHCACAFLVAPPPTGHNGPRAACPDRKWSRTVVGSAWLYSTPGSSCRRRRPRPLPRLPAAAMSASAVYVLDLKGKVRRAPHPPRCQATDEYLAHGDPPCCWVTGGTHPGSKQRNL